MSELKAKSSGEIRARNALLGYWWYEKSEADKVIEEKDEIIDELKEHIDELQKATDSAWRKVNAMYDELRHQKYKRCLAMARLCEYCENLNDGRGAEIINDERWTDRFNLYKDNEGKYRIECYADHSSPINYCPMCGRKLTEAK